MNHKKELLRGLWIKAHPPRPSEDLKAALGLGALCGPQVSCSYLACSVEHPKP